MNHSADRDLAERFRSISVDGPPPSAATGAQDALQDTTPESASKYCAVQTRLAGSAPAGEQPRRYRVRILTAVGWSTSRAVYRCRRNARHAALWLASLHGVHEAHVIDADDSTTIAEFKNFRRKPR